MEVVLDGPILNLNCLRAEEFESLSFFSNLRRKPTTEYRTFSALPSQSSLI
jgi:hypothetical protein